jgi:hypothetical protein
MARRFAEFADRARKQPKTEPCTGGWHGGLLARPAKASNPAWEAPAAAQRDVRRRTCLRRFRQHPMAKRSAAATRQASSFQTRANLPRMAKPQAPNRHRWRKRASSFSTGLSAGKQLASPRGIEKTPRSTRAQLVSYCRTFSLKRNYCGDGEAPDAIGRPAVHSRFSIIATC